MWAHEKWKFSFEILVRFDGGNDSRPFCRVILFVSMSNYRVKYSEFRKCHSSVSRIGFLLDRHTKIEIFLSGWGSRLRNLRTISGIFGNALSSLFVSKSQFLFLSPLRYTLSPKNQTGPAELWTNFVIRSFVSITATWLCHSCSCHTFDSKIPFFLIWFFCD